MITRDYKVTDPEFAQLFEHFAFDEVVSEESAKLDEADRHLAILAALLGCQGIDEFRSQVSRALKAGLTPVMIKEVVYQATAYLGIGRVRPFLDAVNDIFTEKGIALPLEGQSTTTDNDRLRKGYETQAACSALRCWKPGNKVISTSGSQTTVLVITTPAQVLI